MKAVKSTYAEGISQALTRGHCPVCALIAEFQEQLIAGTQPCEIATLCNYHSWALAKAAPADKAATIFVALLDKSLDGRTSNPESDCSFCEELDKHEATRMNEMVEEFKRVSIRQWMKLQGSVCLRHARKLDGVLPQELSESVFQITVRTRAELKVELKLLLTHLRRGDRTGWGVLGRAAEFLTSQRGMRR